MVKSISLAICPIFLQEEKEEKEEKVEEKAKEPEEPKELEADAKPLSGPKATRFFVDVAVFPGNPGRIWYLKPNQHNNEYW